ncbi:MAG: hypothetical protein AAF289_14275 [Cyanobacteria bacterium P01_A01_bin.135]
MTFSIRFLFTFAVVLGLSSAFGMAGAQTTVDPLEDLQTQDGSSDPFNGSGSATQGGIFDLIHNSVFSNGTSVDQFNEARQENITDEADSFKEQQRRRMEQAQPIPDTVEE